MESHTYVYFYAGMKLSLDMPPDSPHRYLVSLCGVFTMYYFHENLHIFPCPSIIFIWSVFLPFLFNFGWLLLIIPGKLFLKIFSAILLGLSENVKLCLQNISTLKYFVQKSHNLTNKFFKGTAQ